MDQAKRALVALLRTLAAAYACAVRVTRDSADAEIRTAYRAVSRKVHPDRPTGCAADQKRLNAAHEKWQALLKSAPGRGRTTTRHSTFAARHVKSRYAVTKVRHVLSERQDDAGLSS